MPPYQTAANLSAHPSIRHGFFGRKGGVSYGFQGALNISYSLDEDPEAVAENRRRVSEAIGLSPLVVLRQVHSNAVVTVGDGALPDDTIEADAMVTNQPGILLGILTADCAPILFADPKAGVIGAAHAGWKGAANGIVANTIAAMVSLGAEPANIIAAIGPLISSRNYEVGPQFKADFLALQPEAEQHFHIPPHKTREHFDLRGFVQSELAAAGLSSIDRLFECTYATSDLYFSHRYATHSSLKAGRQVSVIGLT